jgi:hypothetical protein
LENSTGVDLSFTDIELQGDVQADLALSAEGGRAFISSVPAWAAV